MALARNKKAMPTQPIAAIPYNLRLKPCDFFRKILASTSKQTEQIMRIVPRIPSVIFITSGSMRAFFYH